MLAGHAACTSGTLLRISSARQLLILLRGCWLWIPAVPLTHVVLTATLPVSVFANALAVFAQRGYN
jgi:hypothetical protein